MLRDMIKPNHQALWYQTLFGYEFTWVSKHSTYYAYKDRLGEMRLAHSENKFRTEQDIDDAIRCIHNRYNCGGSGELYRHLVARTKLQYDEMRGDIRVAHRDIDCLEVSTPACSDWRWHIDFFRDCDKIARQHDLTRYRMRGVEQTQDMHVNVSFPACSYERMNDIAYTMNCIGAMFPVVIWIFAAAYNNDTARIPEYSYEWGSFRSKSAGPDNYRLEFRAPCMMKTELEIRAVGEFHRKLFTFAYMLGEQEKTQIRRWYKHHELKLKKRLKTITFQECMQDFAFLCNLLDVDIRCFERIAYHNLWRRLQYYPECRI